MRKLRLLSMILALAMLFTCCFGTHLATVAAATGTEPTFTVTSGTGEPGDDVTVTVDISNNPGICTATVWVHYDEGLALKSATDSRLLVGGIFGGDKSANPYGLYWDDSANFDGDNSSNGTLATLVFTINEEATNGDYDVWVTYKSGDIYNIDLDDFEFECVAGKITVTGGACSHKYTNYVSDGNATCQADGTKTAVCDNGCGTKDTITDVGSKVAHKYTTYTPNNDATCETNGTKTASCDYGCGTKDTLTIEDSELGHSYTEYVSDGNATCEADGTKTATCDNGCGTKDTVADTGSKIPHSFRNYTSNGDSTCFSDGTKTAYCEYGCGEKETVTDTGSKKTHSYTSYTYNDDATYEADGTETASCAHGCGTTDTRTKVGSKLVDTTLPTGEIKVKENGWKSFLNTISFGLFCKDKFDVTITAEDNETGVKSVEYYKSSTSISEDDIKDVTGWTSGKSFSVENEGKYIVYVKITDNAGNIAYISSDGIVVDTTAPVISGIENGKSYCESKTFTVSDTYLDTVSVNGTVTADYKLAAVSANGTEYTIVATDKAGNSATVKVTVYIEHKYSVYTSNNDATCTSDGTKTAICANGCGATDTIADTGSKKDHSFTNYVSNNDATCESNGTETATCDYNCGNSDTRTDLGSKLGHKYTNYVSDGNATCEADGTETAECDNGCGKADTRDAADSKLGHKYTDYKSNNDATCTVDGTETATCDNGCGKTDNRTDVDSKLGHKYTNYLSNNNATCMANGTETAECDNGCGEFDTRDVENSKLAHKYTNYEYQNDATYFADGTEKASCDYNCGTTDTRTKAGTKLIDTTLPTGEIKVKENGWKSFLNTISFGLFYKEKVDVTITAEDNETGIDTVEYYKSSSAISEDDIKDVSGWTSGNSFSVESEGQYIIYVKITDKAGNVAYISTNGIVVDTTAPVIAGIENGKTYCETKTFTVSDDHLDSVTVNSVKTTDYTLADGEYTIVATDKAGNTVTIKVNVFYGHSYTNYQSNNDATCQADGTKTATCDNGCGSTNTVADAGSKKTHSYTNYVSNNDATCTADGTEIATCDYNCGTTDVRTDANSKIAHKFTNYVSNNDATCTANGTETASCDYNCGNTDTRTDDGSMLAHKYTNYVSNNDATCETDGTETAECDYNCGHKDTRVDADSKLGHKYTNYVSNNDATCEADGTETAVCDNNCGKSDTRTDENSKLGHKYTNYVSDNNATCQADGTKTAVCENSCGKSDTVADTGSKTEHKYTNYTSNNDATCQADGTKTANCDYNCGTTDTKADIGSKTTHRYTNYVSNNDATCTEDGTETAVCDYNCGKSDTRTDADSKLGHSYGEWIIVTKPTADSVGEKKRECSVCHDIQTEKLVSTIISGTSKVEGILNENVDLIFENVTTEIKNDQKEEMISAINKMVSDKTIPNNSSLISIFDIKLVIEDTTDEVDITDKVKITFVIPADILKMYENINMVHFKDDGSCEFIKLTINSNNTATFETDGFSYYALTGVEKKTDDKIDTSNNPQTGDNSNMTIWIMILCVSAICLAAIIFAKGRKTNCR